MVDRQDPKPNLRRESRSLPHQVVGVQPDAQVRYSALAHLRLAWRVGEARNHQRARAALMLRSKTRFAHTPPLDARASPRLIAAPAQRARGGKGAVSQDLALANAVLVRQARVGAANTPTGPTGARREIHAQSAGIVGNLIQESNV